MQVTSTDLVNGVWNTEITNTAKGQNRTPQLSFEEIPGAEEYAVYMLDPDADNWLHWRAHGITETNLEGGQNIASSEYKGPYPPAGTHTYQVIVYALEGQADSYPGNFDAGGNDLTDIEAGLDTADGSQGNIIAKGELKGTYTAGD